MSDHPFEPVNQQAAEFRQCFKCNFEDVTVQEICPRCRKKMYTSGNIRTRGVVVMIAGLFIAGLMAAIAVGVGLLLAGAMKDSSSARKINDEFPVLVGIYVLFAALIGLGLQFIVMGGWMAVFGKRNRILLWLMWAGIIVVLGFGFLLRVFL